MEDMRCWTLFLSWLKPSDDFAPCIRLADNAQDESLMSMDKVSELPDHILHDILSCLSTKQVYQTTVLSKRWLLAVQSFPILDFDEAYFGLSWRSSDTMTSIDYQTAKKKFMKHVDDSMQKFIAQKLRMKRFKISTSLLHDDAISLVNNWVGVAVDNLVEEINLTFGVRPVISYRVPQIISGAASFKDLSLSGCKLDMPFSINLISLRKLSLKNVQLDQIIMDRLIASCPFLEDLIIKNCRDLRSVKILGLGSLKRTKISSWEGSSFQSIRIEAPNLVKADISGLDIELESILIEAPNLDKLVLCYAYSSDNFHSKFKLRVSSSLKDVYFWSVDISDQCLVDLMNNAHQIKNLDLSLCNKLEKIKISSCWLSRLAICDCRKLEEAEVNAPNLHCFSYTGKPLSCFAHSSPFCSADIYFHGLTSCELIHFLSSPIQYHMMTLHLKLKSQEKLFKKLRKVSLPASWIVKHLGLDVKSHPSNYATLLAILLVSCKPTTLRVWIHPETNNTFVKYVYWRLKQGPKDCSKAVQTKCWRHQLKDVKLMNCFGSPDFPDKFPTLRQCPFSLAFQLEWRSQTPPFLKQKSTQRCEERNNGG